MRTIPIPINTRLGHDVRDGRDVFWARHDVHSEAAGQMPRDVAVERPDAGVIGFELQSGEAAGADGLDVAAGGVLAVADTAVPGAGAFVEDVHVVAVEVEAGRC
jgi:hypothetical protein